MTKTKFKKLCYSYQHGPYSEGFNANNLVYALQEQDIEFDDLNSHDAVKDWFKDCIDNEYNIGPVITEWYNEGFADYYKVDMSMGTIASITALATAEDFYYAFEDWYGFEDDDTEWDPDENEEEDEDE